jgi:hypothetical protein
MPEWTDDAAAQYLAYGITVAEGSPEAVPIVGAGSRVASAVAAAWAL